MESELAFGKMPNTEDIYFWGFTCLTLYAFLSALPHSSPFLSSPILNILINPGNTYPVVLSSLFSWRNLLIILFQLWYTWKSYSRLIHLMDSEIVYSITAQGLGKGGRFGTNIIDVNQIYYAIFIWQQPYEVPISIFLFTGEQLDALRGKVAQRRKQHKWQRLNLIPGF